jgi:hypothetical protein
VGEVNLQSGGLADGPAVTGAGREQAAFETDYAAARAAFLAAAAASGAVLDAAVHPEARGPRGETLAIDLARFGSGRAERVLLMIAGTHGSEACAISALFDAAMRAGLFAAMPADQAVVLVHGLNPYGFAHGLRTNEDHVDLNRNFIDFAAPLPANPGYAALHADLCVDPTHPEQARLARARIAAWRAHNGQDAYMAALFNGQYTHADGLLYGGQAPSWSNRALGVLLRRHLRGARTVAFIDWHTGLGEYGQPFFLCFNAPDSAAWAACCDWWGRERIEHTTGFDGGARPRYAGLVFQGVEALLAPAAFAGAVIEWGTTPPERTIEGLQLDRWLRVAGDALAPAERARLGALAMESFCPSDPVWQRNVISGGLAIITRTLRGLAAWQPAAADRLAGDTLGDNLSDD